MSARRTASTASWTSLAELAADSRGSLNATALAGLSQPGLGSPRVLRRTIEAAEHRGLDRASRRFGLHIVVATGHVGGTPAADGTNIVPFTAEAT